MTAREEASWEARGFVGGSRVQDRLCRGVWGAAIPEGCKFFLHRPCWTSPNLGSRGDFLGVLCTGSETQRKWAGLLCITRTPRRKIGFRSALLGGTPGLERPSSYRDGTEGKGSDFQDPSSADFGVQPGSCRQREQC